MMRLQLQSAAFFLIGPFVLPALVHCSLHYNSPSSSILMILPSDKQTMVLESSLLWIGYKSKGDPPRSSWGLLSIASSLLIIITASHQVEFPCHHIFAFVYLHLCICICVLVFVHTSVSVSVSPFVLLEFPWYWR